MNLKIELYKQNTNKYVPRPLKQKYSIEIWYNILIYRTWELILRKWITFVSFSAYWPMKRKDELLLFFVFDWWKAQTRSTQHCFDSLRSKSQITFYIKFMIIRWDQFHVHIFWRFILRLHLNLQQMLLRMNSTKLTFIIVCCYIHKKLIG